MIILGKWYKNKALKNHFYPKKCIALRFYVVHLKYKKSSLSDD